ncbi:MAG: arsenate reductase ArsC, partial [Chloroflexota bacterium]
ALIEHLSNSTVVASSAGSRPKPLHPNAVRVMHERGIDIGGQRTKHLTEFIGDEFAFVVTLCDRVREVCPEFPGHPQAIHWSMADPAAEGSSDEETYPAFQRTAAELETRIRFLLHVIESTRLKQEVN